MEESFAFESFLYVDDNEAFANDMEFCADRIVMLPKIRPHKLEKAVSLSVKYCQIADFRRKILEKSNKCPVLVYKLFKRGIFVFNEIEPFLKNEDAFLICYYFQQEIEDFDSFIQKKRNIFSTQKKINFFEQFNQSEYISNEFEKQYLCNTNNIDHFIEYGFLPSSIEYCIKYDVNDDLASFEVLKPEALWSPFEWSLKPQYLDLLSFSGFYGSIKCFKHLLMKGFMINKEVLSMVVCSGCLDLFHLCHEEQLVTNECVCKASEFSHLSLLAFMLENGADIKAKGEYDNTPLHCAALNGNLCVVGFLVNQKVEINAQSNGSPTGTPLHFASINGHIKLVEYLVNQKADINSCTTSDEVLNLIGLLFIMLLQMAILVLLNISLAKKPKLIPKTKTLNFYI